MYDSIFTLEYLTYHQNTHGISHQNNHGISHLNNHGIYDNARGYDDDHSRGVAYFQNSTSLAETTLARYNAPNTTAQPASSDSNVETRVHPETGVQHPYNASMDFLSRFPLGFR